MPMPLFKCKKCENTKWNGGLKVDYGGRKFICTNCKHTVVL